GPAELGDAVSRSKRANHSKEWGAKSRPKSLLDMAEGLPNGLSAFRVWSSFSKTRPGGSYEYFDSTRNIFKFLKLFYKQLVESPGLRQNANRCSNSTDPDPGTVWSVVDISD